MRRQNKIKLLQDQVNRLKKTVLKTTSKVNPESNRLLITEAKHSIQILGINALGTLHHCREEIIQFLDQRKGLLHILLLDPDSKSFTQRTKKEKDIFDRLNNEWKASISIIAEIQKKSKRKNNIEIRLYNSDPLCSLLIIDALQDDCNIWQMLINDYPIRDGKRGYEGGQFLSQYSILRDKDSFDKRYSYYTELWEKSKVVK